MIERSWMRFLDSLSGSEENDFHPLAVLGALNTIGKTCEIWLTRTYQRRLFAKACPDPVLRYRSNSAARRSS